MQHEGLALAFTQPRERVLHERPLRLARIVRTLFRQTLVRPAPPRLRLGRARTDVICRLIEPSRDIRPPQQRARLRRERGEDLLRDIARQLRVARAPQSRADHEPLILPDDFGKRVLISLLRPAGKKSRVIVDGGFTVHS